LLRGGERKNMSRLDLKFTFQCNNRCVFCVQGDKREHVEDKTGDELRAELQAYASSCDAVVFTGGEVTLREDLVEMIRHARDLGYRSIQVQTNGRRMSYAPFVDELIEAGVTEFAPALHGANAATHDRLVRAKGAFKQTVKGIVQARKRGARVVLNSVILQQNYRQLPDMARLFVKLGVPQAQFAFVHAVGSAGTHFRHVVPRYSAVMPMLRKALLIGEQAGMRMMTEAVPYCLLRGLERFCAEAIMPATAIVDGDMRIENYEQYRFDQGKLRGPTCSTCTWKARCEGPWREYPEHFGWEEFEPRTDTAALTASA